MSSCSLNFSLILISAFCSAVMLALIRLLGFFLTRRTLAFFLPGSMVTRRLWSPAVTGRCKMSESELSTSHWNYKGTQHLHFSSKLSVVGPWHESFMGSLSFNFASQHFRKVDFLCWSNIGFYVFKVQKHPIKTPLFFLPSIYCSILDCSFVTNKM